jgi:hypothetical protein
VATIEEIDALVAPATPHFAYQLRARVEELVLDLSDRLGHASSKADDARRESPTRPGWREIPSSAPADRPLPKQR